MSGPTIALLGISYELTIGRFAGIEVSVRVHTLLASDPVPLVEEIATCVVFLNGGIGTLAGPSIEPISPKVSWGCSNKMRQALLPSIHDPPPIPTITSGANSLFSCNSRITVLILLRQFTKSPLFPLCQRGKLLSPSLEKRGGGRFSDQTAQSIRLASRPKRYLSE